VFADAAKRARLNAASGLPIALELAYQVVHALIPAESTPY
jgi:hypothetical protein